MRMALVKAIETAIKRFLTLKLDFPDGQRLLDNQIGASDMQSAIRSLCGFSHSSIPPFYNEYQD